MGTNHVHADGAGETQVEAAGMLVLTPHLGARFLNDFLELKGVSMDGNFKFPDGMATGQIADGIAGQKQNHSRIARSIP